jgi:glycosylphosphatidylinositol transamidase (GPIT) subunit GPI8
VGVIDRYTHVILNYLEGINKTSTESLEDLFDQYSFDLFHSNAGIRRDLYPRDTAQVRLTEFFGGVTPVEMSGSHKEKLAQAEHLTPSTAISKQARSIRRTQLADSKSETKAVRDATSSALCGPSVVLALALIAAHLLAWVSTKSPTRMHSKQGQKLE